MQLLAIPILVDASALQLNTVGGHRDSPFLSGRINRSTSTSDHYNSLFSLIKQKREEVSFFVESVCFALLLKKIHFSEASLSFWRIASA